MSGGTARAEGDDDLPTDAYLVALASLSRVGPRRMAALLAGRTPAQAWTLVRRGRVTELPEVVAALGREVGALPQQWVTEAARLRPGDALASHLDAGIEVSSCQDGALADLFADDPEPPQVLFHRGDVMVAAGPRVGIVGTRRCTRYGRDVAFELGRELAGVGVRVVSGLALGIDAAAHAGALDAAPGADADADADAEAGARAGPIAVVGSGLDIQYPRRNAELWRAVERVGLVLSEYPLGRRPQTWQFPARNRLIAGLSDVLVVVESAERGGSMYTVAEALARDRPVMAVPGSVRSPASAGTNRLLAEGAHVARSAEDVLVQLGLAIEVLTRAPEVRTPPTGQPRVLLDELGWEPASLEHLVLRLGWGLAEVSAAVAALEDDGWVARTGGWVERVSTSR